MRTRPLRSEFRTVAILVAAVLLVACGDSADPASNPDAPAPTAPATPSAAAPATRPSPDQIAAATRRIDAAGLAAANAMKGDWVTYGRTYDEQRHSPLDAINDRNVEQLGLAWSLETGFERGHEATPLVVDGVMFVTLPWSVVIAVDARSGEELWRYDPKVPRDWGRRACCDVVNRGAALWKGRVYVGTLDGRLVSIDAATGELVWEVNTIDRSQPYTITGAPRVVKDKVVIGNGGAEYGVRGYVSAYDAATGEQVWRFYTVPGDPTQPDEHPEMGVAKQTWTGEWWKYGGGGTVWDSMAFDPELDLLYIGTGNGSPWSRAIRSPQGGDNLYLSSILALRPDTGELLWHYQTTPADNWDYTAVQHMILADLDWEGKSRQVLMQAPKNGFFYILDRWTGELLSAEKYVQVSWASHVDLATGRPVELPEGDYDDTPRVVLPSPNGGHIWHPMSYDPKTGLVYIPALEVPGLFSLDPSYEHEAGAWNLGLDIEAYDDLANTLEIPPAWGELKAWDPVAGKAAWTVRHPGAFNGGVLSTAGNLVFQGTGDGRFAAYAADTGEKLWEVNVGVGIVAPPIAYEVDGVQYVSVLAGWGGGGAIEGGDAGVAAAEKWENRGRLFSFRLGGTEPLPEPVVLVREIAQPLPDLGVDAEGVERGTALFNRYCLMCHGILAVTSGVVPDLRYATPEIHDQWNDIVLGGIRVHDGMASFADVLSLEDAVAIHAYVVERARETLAEEAEGGS